MEQFFCLKFFGVPLSHCYDGPLIVELVKLLVKMEIDIGLHYVLQVLSALNLYRYILITESTGIIILKISLLSMCRRYNDFKIPCDNLLASFGNIKHVDMRICFGLYVLKYT